MMSGGGPRDERRGERRAVRTGGAGALASATAPGSDTRPATINTQLVNTYLHLFEFKFKLMIAV